MRTRCSISHLTGHKYSTVNLSSIGGMCNCNKWGRTRVGWRDGD
ncbi:hypothetical protein DO70_5000 [Burkholderia pseudomallei]|nr:hypothetical protein DO70_5000 [Burkholderia pseudomallei]